MAKVLRISHAAVVKRGMFKIDLLVISPSERRSMNRAQEG